MCGIVYLERITANNIDFAVSIQNELFPGESARVNYEESLEDSSDNQYYLIYEANECVGIIGLYCQADDPESARLGWYGIREGFRRRHLGSVALKRFEDMAVAGGYRFARLYTDALNNDTAITFYRANGYISEPYLNLEDSACLRYKTLIFSEPLSDDPLIFWNDRNIHLTEQIEKQRRHH